MSTWGGAYLDTQFSGPTVSLVLGAASDVLVSIDGSAFATYKAATGIVDVTPSALNSGVHTLRIAARFHSDATHPESIRFRGLQLASGYSVQAPQSIPSSSIEFIGDSITAGFEDTNGAASDYAWLTGEALHVDHTQIAYTGICLTDNVPCYSPNQIGMSRAFLKTQTPDYPNSANWNFSTSQPGTVVINLGTNDGTIGRVPAPTFQANYLAFLKTVRSVYPAARIVALRTFNGYYAAETQAAVQSFLAQGNSNATFIDTPGWISSGDYVTGDPYHPSDLGQEKLAAQLASALAPTIHPTTVRPNYFPTIEDFADVSDWSEGTDHNAKLYSDGSLGVVSCICGNGLAYGSVTKTLPSFDLDAHPSLSMTIAGVSPSNGDVQRGQWGIKVSDGIHPDVTLHSETSDQGELTMNVRSITGWSGTQNLTLKFFVLHGSVEIQSINTEARQLLDNPSAQWATLNANRTADRQGFLVQPTGASYGYAATALAEDVDEYPQVLITIDALPAGGQWALKVTGGGQDIELQHDTTFVGSRTFDLRAITGWHGVQQFQLKIFAIGSSGSAVHVSSLQRPAAALEPFKQASGWSGNGALLTASAGVVTVTAQQTSAGYGYVLRPVQTNLDTSPRVALSVQGLTTGTRWALKVNDGSGDRVLQPDINATGTFSYDIRSPTGWSGSKAFNLEIFVIGNAGGSVSMTPIYTLA